MVQYSPSLLLEYARTYGNRFFLQFGLHCATHQIRVILISGIVITSLFYPALALYFNNDTLSSFSRPVSLFDVTRNPQDLLDVWSGHDSLRVLGDTVSRAKTHASCGSDNALRVERIFIQSSFDGAVNHQILQSTYDLERRIEELQLGCLERPDASNGECFVLSPLAFWGYNEATLREDHNILDTLLTRNASVSGIPITPQMVLAGRGSDDQGTSGTFDYAAFLALTYFFPNSDCLGTAEHIAWLQALDVASAGAPRTMSLKKHVEPTLIQLEYHESLKLGKEWTALSTVLYLAYGAFVVYVSWSMRQMDAVHSRVGLTFTALVEIAVSTITSLSVCALVGFKVTLVPWELLPIVIVFVGAENMFNLVGAVGKTSVTLSVKQRIAEGLSHAGTSNTLKVVSYNSILGIISVFSTGAIRQFCVFAIVVLVAHWFLAHTFFMAVLSIDIQRLELDDLLRQNPSLAPVVPKDVAFKQSHSPREKVVAVIQKLLHGRATKNISLFMLLAITATLYYTTIPPDTRLPLEEVQPLTRAKMNVSTPMNQPQSPAWNIWKTLNPNETTLYLRIEEPTVLTFRSEHSPADHKALKSKMSMRTFRAIFWTFKIVVAPIAASTGLLYGLLLYLLKDAELLEAQRNRPDGDSVEKEMEEPLTSQIAFSTLPRAFNSDVELMATSQDGNVVACVGLNNEVVIWRLPNRKHIAIDVTNVLLRSASSSKSSSTLTSVAVDCRGHYCAVGTGSGNIAVWSIDSRGITPLPLLSLADSSAGVVSLHFLTPSNRTSPCSEPNSPLDREAAVTLLATYENGIAAYWKLGIDPSVTYHLPTKRGVALIHVTLLRVGQDVLLGFSMADGTLELVEVQVSRPLVLPDHPIAAGNPADLVSAADACLVDLCGTTRLVVAVTTESGIVSLWDGGSGEMIRLLDGSHGRINRLRVSPVSLALCSSCGKLPFDGCLLACSADQAVTIFRLYMTDQPRRCSCNLHFPRRVPSWDSSLGRRSRGPSPNGSPSIPRAKLSAMFEAPQFPVSGHGVHSRRASEKEAAGRRSLETDGDDLLSPIDGRMSSVWLNALVVPVSEMTCDRGAWDVWNRRVVGVRRRPREGSTTTGKPNDESGLSPATLERWEVWLCDVSGTRSQSSSLAALKQDRVSESVAAVPRLPFTRVAPLVVVSQRAVAGFGNTVGVFDLTL
ncbi:unnamed protein product [Mycena citricolor]|uniref:Sterol regulatory element-binding protein cleavage-activating protein n=1 Tax=Mycena citricolor TaxID=2018698 RepID=A0AAD2HT91_9AGAR|nr:unnamed protein product [Mycena citricolor]